MKKGGPCFGCRPGFSERSIADAILSVTCGDTAREEKALSPFLSDEAGRRSAPAEQEFAGGGEGGGDTAADAEGLQDWEEETCNLRYFSGSQGGGGCRKCRIA